jgi:hypothetical protein
MMLDGADMIALLVMFSFWAFGLPAFFLLKWLQGQKARRDLIEVGVSTLCK